MQENAYHAALNVIHAQTQLIALSAPLGHYYSIQPVLVHAQKDLMLIKEDV